MNMYLSYLLIGMEYEKHKNKDNSVFHEGTSNQRSGRATTTTRFQIAVRFFFISSKVNNMFFKAIKNT